MSEPLIIVGIAGVARSGKDTIARQLVEHYGFTRIALADTLREILGGMAGSTWEVYKAIEALEVKVSRWAPQVLGTECREDLLEAKESLWCLNALIKVRFLSHYLPPLRRRFVIPDIRFPHEPRILAAHAEHWGGSYLSLKVERPGAGLIGQEATHKSEKFLGEILGDDCIINDGTLAELRESVAVLAKRRGWA